MMLLKLALKVAVIIPETRALYIRLLAMAGVIIISPLLCGRWDM